MTLDTQRRRGARRAPGRSHNRRGATLVLFTLLIVPLLTLAAMAIDVSQWQVGANQVQTVADASALAAARGAELYPSSAWSTATSYANTVAAQNGVFGTATTIPASDVEPYFYDPKTRLATVATWTTYNAVKVTARFTVGLTFSAVAGRSSGPNVVRSAIAWIANVNNGNCVKPWALPYTALYDRATQIAGGTVSSTVPRPDLSQATLAQLNNLPDSTRIVILRPPTYDGTGGNPDSTAALGNRGYNNGMYAAYNFLSPSGNNNASTSTFQANTYGCSSQTVSVSTTNGATLPGSNDIPCAGVNALMGSSDNSCQPSKNWDPAATDWPSANNKPRISNPVTCYYKPPSGLLWDATCYTTSGFAASGATQTVAWGDGVGNGSNTTQFRELGRFKLQCVFRGIYAANGAPSGTSESCVIGSTTLTNYPQGTIVGVIQGLTAPVIGAGVELGNVVSDQQRLILVQ